MRRQSVPCLLGILLVTLLTGTLKAQPVPRAEADSLLRRLQVGKADTNRVNQLIRLGKYHVFKPGEFKADMDSAYSYATESETLSRTLRFSEGHDRSLLLLMQILIESKRIDEIQALLQKSKANKTKATLLLQLGWQYLYKPGELAADLDLAEIYGRQALELNKRLKNERGQIESLMLLNRVFSEKGNELQAANFIRQAISFIKNLKDPLQKAEFWYLLATCYTRLTEDMPEKINAYEQALMLYRQLGNKEREAYMLKEIADMHQHQGKYAQSLRELLEVLRIYKSIGFQNLHYTYDLLAYVHNVMGNYEKALPYALEAINSAKATGDTVDIKSFYSGLALIYLQLGQPQQALKIYLQEIKRQQKANIYVNNIFDLYIVQCMLALNRPRQALAFLKQQQRQYPLKNLAEKTVSAYAHGEIYLAMKDYPLAEHYLLKALDAIKADHANKLVWPRAHVIRLNQKISRLYMESKRYQKAHYHLSQAFEVGKQNNDLLLNSKLHLQGFKLDSLQGNLTSAIAHYQRYKVLQDSVFNERKSNQLIAYQVQYDTEKKEQDLKLKEQNIALLSEQNKSQQASMEQQQTQRNALIGGTALLLLTLGLGYNRYRLKQRTNKQLEAQQSLLKAQQKEITEKNEHLSELLGEKDSLLLQKDFLIGEKEELLQDKDSLLFQQKRLLEEKERLLKEIHHRVKNNLQIVMSLLNSQAASLQDKAALSAIQESQHRVQAMALIHQKLYQAEGIARIPMKAYIEEVVAYLQDSYNLNYHVGFALQVEDIELDVTQAVPLGLIINEAITNACKYAFPDGRSGKISVQLHCKAEYTYELTIADNGVGLPKEFDPSRSRSLGMTLLHGFSAQLEGELSITSDQGLSIRLAFAQDQLSSIPDKLEYASYS